MGNKNSQLEIPNKDDNEMIDYESGIENSESEDNLEEEKSPISTFNSNLDIINKNNFVEFINKIKESRSIEEIGKVELNSLKRIDNSLDNIDDSDISESFQLLYKGSDNDYLYDGSINVNKFVLHNTDLTNLFKIIEQENKKGNPHIGISIFLWFDTFHDFKKDSRMERINNLVSKLYENKKDITFLKLYRSSFFDHNEKTFVNDVKHTVLKHCFEYDKTNVKKISHLLYRLYEHIVDKDFESDLLYNYINYFFFRKPTTSASRIFFLNEEKKENIEDDKIICEKDEEGEYIFDIKEYIKDLRSIINSRLIFEDDKCYARDVEDRNFKDFIFKSDGKTQAKLVSLPSSLFDANRKGKANYPKTYTKINETSIPYACGLGNFKYEFTSPDNLTDKTICDNFDNKEKENLCKLIITNEEYTKKKIITSCCKIEKDKTKTKISDIREWCKKNSFKDSFEEYKSQVMKYLNDLDNDKNIYGFSVEEIGYITLSRFNINFINEDKLPLDCKKFDKIVCLKRIGDFGQILQAKQLGIPLSTTDRMEVLLSIVCCSSIIWKPADKIFYYNGKEDCFLQYDELNKKYINSLYRNDTNYKNVISKFSYLPQEIENSLDILKNTSNVYEEKPKLITEVDENNFIRVLSKQPVIQDIEEDEGERFNVKNIIYYTILNVDYTYNTGEFQKIVKKKGKSNKKRKIDSTQEVQTVLQFKKGEKAFLVEWENYEMKEGRFSIEKEEDLISVICDRSNNYIGYDNKLLIQKINSITYLEKFITNWKEIYRDIKKKTEESSKMQDEENKLIEKINLINYYNSLINNEYKLFRQFLYWIYNEFINPTIFINNEKLSYDASANYQKHVFTTIKDKTFLLTKDIFKDIRNKLKTLTEETLEQILGENSKFNIPTVSGYEYKKKDVVKAYNLGEQDSISDNNILSFSIKLIFENMLNDLNNFETNYNKENGYKQQLTNLGYIFTSPIEEEKEKMEEEKMEEEKEKMEEEKMEEEEEKMEEYTISKSSKKSKIKPNTQTPKSKIKQTTQTPTFARSSQKEQEQECENEFSNNNCTSLSEEKNNKKIIMYETYGCCFYKELYDYLKDIINPNNITEKRFKNLSHLRSSFKKKIFNPENIKDKQTNTIKEVPKIDDLIQVLNEYCNVNIYYGNRSNYKNFNNNKDITVYLYQEDNTKYGIFLKSDQELQQEQIIETPVKKLKFDIPLTPIRSSPITSTLNRSSKKRTGQEIENIRMKDEDEDEDLVETEIKKWWITEGKNLKTNLIDMNLDNFLTDLQEKYRGKVPTTKRAREIINKFYPSPKKPKLRIYKSISNNKQIYKLKKRNKSPYKRSLGRKIKRYPK
jgi:hypothetical protein